MKQTIRNIINLSNIFIKENDKYLNVFDQDNKKINTKSMLFWSYLIIFFAVFYISSKVIEYTISIQKPSIYLNGFLLFLQMMIILKTIMVSMNVFYFSKDIDNIIHMPFKPIEILISKFNAILFMNYELEIIIALVPLLMYQVYTYINLPSIINLIIILISFPIFATVVISVLLIILMKLVNFFKNKDIMQICISSILTISIMFGLSVGLKYVFDNQEMINDNKEMVYNNIDTKLIQLNKCLISIEPASNILQENSILVKILNYIKLILINICVIIIFIIAGNTLYLKQLLKAKFYYKNKKAVLSENKLNKKCKKKSKGKSYVKKEFKILLKNPLFFIQNIYPTIILTITIVLILMIFVPIFRELIIKEEYTEIRDGLKFNIEAVCIIIGGIQIIGLFNYTSITAFSREGQNAYMMKILPISLYKQFVYKNIPQILINTISSIIILAIINYKIPEIGIKYIVVIGGLTFLLTMINSFILCLIDLLMPKLKWNSEYEILRNNKNKLLQYVLLIFNIIFLISINNLFNKFDLNISLSLYASILISIFIIINIYINKYKNKLYRKI